jgi:hypothetical protein
MDERRRALCIRSSSTAQSFYRASAKRIVQYMTKVQGWKERRGAVEGGGLL